MTIKIIVSICHTAATNATLLPPPPPHYRRTSKCATATAKIALPPSCCLRRQASRRGHVVATATSAPELPPPAYHCLQNKNFEILLTNLFFTTMVMAARSNGGRNQSTCIEKDKPKNNNKIKQHEKTNPSFNPPLLFPCPAPFLLKQLPLQLSSPSIPTTTSDACGQPSPPPSSPQRRQQQRRFFTIL